MFSWVDVENWICVEVGVEDYWCLCLNLEEILVNELVVEELLKFVVSYINYEFFKNLEVVKLCYELDFVEVKNVFCDMLSGII